LAKQIRVKWMIEALVLLKRREDASEISGESLQETDVRRASRRCETVEDGSQDADLRAAMDVRIESVEVAERRLQAVGLGLENEEPVGLAKGEGVGQSLRQTSPW
jgi:hypothetical protein